MLRKNKVTVVLNDEERKFLDDCRAFYFGEGRPVTISGLVRELIFDNTNRQFKDLNYALGNEGL